ncbi:unnamed protein product [Adineta steineri]|uniref:Palmitoyltransferase n=1 Tax=Adineta steineri TaxID=433720 RepID=A0A814UCP1_9BILA|nr:unnamed protein product [Adineta steineri]CAF3696655.1 unnamed protein product [Adineta steineri]
MSLKEILFSTMNAFNCLMKWFPLNMKDPLSLINSFMFWSWFIIIFYNYFKTIFLGPGFLRKRWRPKNKEDEKYLQYCTICQGFKTSQAYHCRKCSRCISKFDHHCPWMNTCIGHVNQTNFCWFLFYSILGCLHALLMISPCIYRVLFIPYSSLRINEPRIYFTLTGLISSILTLGFTIGVIIAVGLLLIIQIKNIICNHRRTKSFIYPYNLGFKENICQLFNRIDYFNLITDG